MIAAKNGAREIPIGTGLRCGDLVRRHLFAVIASLFVLERIGSRIVASRGFVFQQVGIIGIVARIQFIGRHQLGPHIVVILDGSRIGGNGIDIQF